MQNSPCPGEPETETGKGLPHTEPGMLSVSRNVDFAGYILTLAPAPRLDRDHAAVGRLIAGAAFLEHIISARDSACKEVRVVNCGEVLRDMPQHATERSQSGTERSASRSRSPRGQKTYVAVSLARCCAGGDVRYDRCGLSRYNQTQSQPDMSFSGAYTALKGESVGRRR